MTAIDDAISSIQQVQNDFANLTTMLQAYQNGTSQGLPIDKTTLKTNLQTLATKIVNDLQTVKTNVTTAVQGL